MNNQFSVVVTQYNNEKYARKNIEAILNQSYDDYEVIIVDDGSSDSTLSILKEYLNEEKITLISKANGGVSFARLEGLKHANNPWIVFVDGDDIVHKDMLKILNKACTDDVDIIKFNWNSFSEEFEDEQSQKDVFDEKIYETDYYFKKGHSCQISNYTPLIWDKAYKSDLLKGDKIQKYFEKCMKKCPYNFFEDQIIIPLVLSLSNKIKTIGNELTHYRVTNEGLCAGENISGYHFECDLIGEEKIKLVENAFGRKAACIEAVDTFSYISSIWYRGHLLKKNSKEFKEFEDRLIYFIKNNSKYLGEYKYSYGSKKAYIIKWSSLIFCKSRLAWSLLLEPLYFKRKYRHWFQ